MNYVAWVSFFDVDSQVQIVFEQLPENKSIPFHPQAVLGSLG